MEATTPRTRRERGKRRRGDCGSGDWTSANSRPSVDRQRVGNYQDPGQKTSCVSHGYSGAVASSASSSSDDGKKSKKIVLHGQDRRIGRGEKRKVEDEDEKESKRGTKRKVHPRRGSKQITAPAPPAPVEAVVVVVAREKKTETGADPHVQRGTHHRDHRRDGQGSKQSSRARKRVIEDMGVEEDEEGKRQKDVRLERHGDGSDTDDHDDTSARPRRGVDNQNHRRRCHVQPAQVPQQQPVAPSTELKTGPNTTTTTAAESQRLSKPVSTHVQAVQVKRKLSAQLPPRPSPFWFHDPVICNYLAEQEKKRRKTREWLERVHGEVDSDESDESDEEEEEEEQEEKELKHDSEVDGGASAMSEGKNESEGKTQPYGGRGRKGASNGDDDREVNLRRDDDDPYPQQQSNTGKARTRLDGIDADIDPDSDPVRSSGRFSHRRRRGRYRHRSSSSF